MDPLVILSPHFDDAVLSAGQLMAGRPDMVVCTVFAGCPDTNASTEFDLRSGFANARAAIATRRQEDDRAAKLLQASTVRLGFIDNQYRTVHVTNDYSIAEAITAELLGVLDAMPTRELLAPFGIAHPDHELVNEAALVCVEHDVDVSLYEELPGRVLWPEKIVRRAEQLRLRGYRLEPVFMGTGEMRRKKQAVDAYRSQLWALDRHCLFVPERFHRVTLCG